MILCVCVCERERPGELSVCSVCVRERDIREKSVCVWERYQGNIVYLRVWKRSGQLCACVSVWDWEIRETVCMRERERERERDQSTATPSRNNAVKFGKEVLRKKMEATCCQLAQDCVSLYSTSAADAEHTCTLARGSTLANWLYLLALLNCALPECNFLSTSLKKTVCLYKVRGEHFLC